MAKLDLRIILVSLAASAIAACSGGPNDPTSLPTNPVTTGGLTPLASSARLDNTEHRRILIPLDETGRPVTLPAAPGLTERITLPENDAPRGAALEVTVAKKLPSALPQIPAKASRPFASFTLKSSTNVTLHGYPKFFVGLRAKPPGRGAFYAWIYSSGSGWRDLGPVTVSGKALRFGGTTETMRLHAGEDYTVIPFTAAPNSVAVTFTEFPIASGDNGPTAMTVSPDGNAWFLSTDGVNRMTTAGSVMTFNTSGLTSYSNDTDIIVGPDGTLWFTADCADLALCPQGSGEQLARITTSGSLNIVGVTVSDNSHIQLPTYLATGPGGTIWATGTRFSGLGEIGGQYLSLKPSGTMASVLLQHDLPFACPQQSSAQIFLAEGVTEGSDGAMYIAALAGTFLGPGPCIGGISAVLRVDSSGNVANTFMVPTAANGDSLAIASGPDGNLWIAQGGQTNAITRVTLMGSVKQFPIPTPNAGPERIVAGNDGAMWFTEMNASKIGRITTDGTVTEYATPSAGSEPFGIASLQGECTKGHGRIWFTEYHTGKIGRIDF